jgi:hypothetical protein
VSAAIAAAGIGAAATVGVGVANASAGKSANSKSGKISQENLWQIMHGMYKAQDEANAKVDPWYNSGTQANQWLTDAIRPGGELAQNYGMEQYKNDPGYTPMVNSLEELQNTPGYQFQLQQGQQGLDNQAAASGGLLSGKQLKATSQYQQGVAAQGYQSAWDRAQAAYQSAFTRNMQQKQNRYDQLSGVSNTGYKAGALQGGNLLNTAGDIANYMTGNARTQSTLAQDNGQIAQGRNTAITGAVNDFVSDPKLQSYASNLFKPNANTGADTNLNNAAYSATDNYLKKYFG